MKLLLPLFIGLSASSIIPSKRLEITVDVISVDESIQLSDGSDTDMDGLLADHSHATDSDNPQRPLSFDLDTTVITGRPELPDGCSSLTTPYKGLDLKCGSTVYGEPMVGISSVSFATCATVCSDLDRCSGVYYDKYSWDCRLVTGKVTSEIDQGYDAAIKIKKAQASVSNKAEKVAITWPECSTVSGPFNGFALRCGLGAYGQMLAVLQDLPFLVCVQTCSTRADCKGISYIKASEECLLLKGEITTKVDSGFDSALQQ